MSDHVKVHFIGGKSIDVTNDDGEELISAIDVTPGTWTRLEEAGPRPRPVWVLGANVTHITSKANYGRSAS